MHLLPGLALFAHRYAPVPEVVGHTWRRMFGGAGKTDLTAQTPPEFFWISGAPLIFYLVWQLTYFLIVQVALQPLPFAAHSDGRSKLGAK